MKKCLNANRARQSDDQLTTVQFHPSAQVVMTAGLDHSVSLFQVLSCVRACVWVCKASVTMCLNVGVLQVDGQNNPKIQSIHLEKFPVYKAQFSRDGEAVIATGLKSKVFYVYDMMGGRVTPVHMVRGQRAVEVSFNSKMLLFFFCWDAPANWWHHTQFEPIIFWCLTQVWCQTLRCDCETSDALFLRSRPLFTCPKQRSVLNQ